MLEAGLRTRGSGPPKRPGPRAPLRRLPPHAGFTLVELLVVISVTLVLAAFLVPRLLAAQDRAKEAAVAALVREFDRAVRMYASDYGYPPGQSMLCGSLADLMVTLGYMRETPRNPFTNAPCTDTDPSGRIEYVPEPPPALMRRPIRLAAAPGYFVIAQVIPAPDPTGPAVLRYRIRGYGRGNARVVIEVEGAP